MLSTFLLSQACLPVQSCWTAELLDHGRHKESSPRSLASKQADPHFEEGILLKHRLGNVITLFPDTFPKQLFSVPVPLHESLMNLAMETGIRKDGSLRQKAIGQRWFSPPSAEQLRTVSTCLCVWIWGRQGEPRAASEPRAGSALSSQT